ncbi:ATPase [Lysobacter helvus]|uniref:ATPase n=2 Tax=Lysobacteraceae TaxID=32033 RepID=A0ABN6FUT9_9GAMM|nr:ATPase [Lysobacter caseinilyticus]BCT95867.1 ATPase [Lysobacter helvus]
MSGQALSPLRGRGMEYAESREYAIGDDARHIDWRLTARSGRPHTKLFQAERERLTLLVADTAPSMYFGTRVRFKSVQAARAGAIATWAALRDGDRIAALRGSTREAPIPPAAGPRGALRVLDALVRWYAAPPADDAGLGVALDHAARLLRPGSRLVVLADPASIAAIPAHRWPAFALHHDTTVLLLVDPLERDPPKAALPFFAAGEAAHRVELDLASPAQRQRWRTEFVAPLDAALQALPARGVRVQIVSTDAPSDAWLGAWGRPQASVA